MPPRTAYSPASRTVCGPREAVVLQPLRQVADVERVARGGRKRLAGEPADGRHALDEGVSRGEHEPRPLPSRANARGATVSPCGGAPARRGSAKRGRRAGSPRPGRKAPRSRARRSRAPAPAPAPRTGVARRQHGEGGQVRAPPGRARASARRQPALPRRPRPRRSRRAGRTGGGGEGYACSLLRPLSRWRGKAPV